MKKVMILLIISLIIFGFVADVHAVDSTETSQNITLYVGQGCTHCAKMHALSDSLSDKYNFSIVVKDVYTNYQYNDELRELWDEYGVPNEQGMRGVPTILMGNSMFIGEISNDNFETALQMCFNGTVCPKGYYYNPTFDLFLNNTANAHPIEPQGNELTWGAIFIGAMADSVNPCTIAVLAMLLTTIFIQKRRRNVILAGLLFTAVIYVMYFLMGIGLLTAIAQFELQLLFLVVMTFLALIMAFLEIKAYLNYKPGMLAIEMPMFLRPHAKKILSTATSYPAIIIAAIFCSLFLLPCSAGPYITILSLVAQAKTVEHLTYLAVYNLIFVLPMIIITIIVGAGLSTPEQVKDAKDKYIKQMHLIAGVLMGLLALFLVMQVLSFFGINLF